MRVAGEYIVGSFGKDGLPVYAAADRPLVDADVVVWYNMVRILPERKGREGGGWDEAWAYSG